MKRTKASLTEATNRWACGLSMAGTLLFLFCFLFNNSEPLYSQSGGDNTYDFLNLTNSARISALGGQQISLYDDDINNVFHNPSLLNKSMTNNLALNYTNYLSDINYGYVSYAHSFKKIGLIGAGIHYIDYGDFIGADIYGNKTGAFTASEQAYNFFYSYELVDSMLSVGATLKAIYSKLNVFYSFGIAMDAAMTYRNPNKLFTAALVFKNLGGQVSTYYDGAPREALPFEVQLGVSQKLKHAPFRISVIARNLEKPNLSYESELSGKKDNLFDETEQKEPWIERFADNTMRHLIIGVEFIPSENFNVQLGYNYKRRKELSILEKQALTGFSWGFGLRVWKVKVNYGRSMYHLSGPSNHFSFLINLKYLYQKF